MATGAREKILELLQAHKGGTLAELEQGEDLERVAMLALESIPTHKERIEAVENGVVKYLKLTQRGGVWYEKNER